MARHERNLKRRQGARNESDAGAGGASRKLRPSTADSGGSPERARPSSSHRLLHLKDLSFGLGGANNCIRSNSLAMRMRTFGSTSRPTTANTDVSGGGRRDEDANASEDENGNANENDEKENAAGVSETPRRRLSSVLSPIQSAGGTPMATAPTTPRTGTPTCASASASASAFVESPVEEDDGNPTPRARSPAP